MTTTHSEATQLRVRPPTTVAAARRWSLPHYLALTGIPILMWEAWTLVAWLRDGPHQITQYRDQDSASWYAARTIEGLAIIISLAVAIHVVRGCLRERRILTFDLMFVLAGATLFWADFFENFFVPTWITSSNWVNLNSPCGHIPFIVNPDCGRVPEPILFAVLLESFVVLGLAIWVGAALRRARNRWPGMTTRKLIGIVILAGFIIDFILEVAVLLPLHLWTYPSPEWMSLPVGHGFRYPFLEPIAAGGWFALMIAVRVFKDDRGQSLVERGLDRHPPLLRKAISLIALYAYMQLAIIAVGNAPLMLYGPYETQWPKLPAHIVNGLCDAPGVHGTRYGPCPGSAGYRMPGRHSLPGRSP